LEAPTYREPPHSIEAEQALLGAMLINNDAFHRVADFLKTNHFSEPLHGSIFEVISELIRSNKVANPARLAEFGPLERNQWALSFYTRSPKRGAMAEVSRRSRPRSTAPLIEPHKRTNPMAGCQALQQASRILTPRW